MLRLLALLMLLAGCSSALSPVGPVHIRVSNESAFHFDQVTVGFPHDEVSYGPVPAQSRSHYQRVEQAYRYAFVEVHTGGDTLVLQPIDYVGERLLTRGHYTYVLELDATGRGLSLSLRSDE
jgi:hypothetical protein